MMAKRGVPVTYETIQEWCQKFGSLYAVGVEKEASAHRIKVAPGRSLHPDEWRASGVIDLTKRLATQMA
jgi:transposase-like protein